MRTPPPSLQALLAQADWVRGLAAAMAGDEAGGGDLAQDAWAVALTHHEPVREPRAWLRAVLQNLARQAARATRRRGERERAGARAEAVEGPSTAVERAELHRRLVDRVMELGEPTRTLVLERFFEGLGPRALARRHGVPLDTVKTRLRRGLAQLRTAMERDQESGRGAWRALCLPLPATLAKSATIAAGALLMSTTIKSILATAAVVLVAIGAWHLTPKEPEEPRGAAPPGGGAAVASASEPRPQAAPTPLDPPVRESVAAPVRLQGRLVGLDPRVAWTTPLAVRLRGGERGEVREARPTADGTFAVGLPDWAADAPFEVEVVADDPGYVRQTWQRAGASGGGEPWLLTVSCAARVEGEVRHRPGTEVQVRAYPLGADGPVPQSVASVRCSGDGGFALRLPAGDYLLIAAATGEREVPRAGVLPASIRATAVVGDVRRVPAMDLPAPVAITGRIMLADGAPLQATLQASPVAGRLLSWAETVVHWWPDDTVAHYEGIGRSDASGRFAIEGLVRKPHAVRLREAQSMVCIERGDSLPTVVAPDDVELRVEGAMLDIVLAAGEPLEEPSLEVRRGGSTSRMPVASGLVRLLVTIGVEYRLKAQAQGTLVGETTWRADGAGHHRLELRLEGGADRVLVLRNVGDDVGDEPVSLWLRPNVPGARSTSVAAQFERGTARLRGVPAGSLTMTMTYSRSGDRRSRLFMAPREVVVPPAGEVEAEIAVRRGGTIRLVANPSGKRFAGSWRLLDDSGHEVETALEVCLPTTQLQTEGRELPNATSAETVKVLAPGSYRVEVDVDGQPRRTLPVEVVAGRCVDVLVPVE